MAHITANEAQAWAEATKLTVTSIDADLEASVSDLILSHLATQFDVSMWVDNNTTPKVVRRVIAMNYIAYLIDKTYNQSEPSTDSYARLLRARVDLVISGLLAGQMVLTDDPNPADAQAGQPMFYPTDESSALTPADTNFLDMSVGPAAFSMGTIF